MSDAWTLVFEGWDPSDEGRREALCTLGNGRFATRGAAPGSGADGVHYPGTYAAGIYNRLRDEIGGRREGRRAGHLARCCDLRAGCCGGGAARRGAGVRRALQSHERTWAQLWGRFHLEFTDGEDPAAVETLRILRLSVFHVLQTLSPHHLDLDAGIPARGLHGEAYRGTSSGTSSSCSRC